MAESKISTIDAQILKLQEKKKKELEKLQRNAGKRFLSTFELEGKSLEEIYSFIEDLKDEKNVNE